MKCHVCNSKVDEGILGKFIGTFVKNSKGKKRLVCNSCQSKLSVDELKEKVE